MQDRVIELEIRLAHFEQTVDELSDLITLQQMDIDRLKTQLSFLLAHISEHKADTGDKLL
ncbi:MAG: SlyX protein [Rickettsiales bacterium]|jgi:uncharacterized coiled-coil protein SlyX|nr:SlyX protein [Rickettsiales bacterium]